MAPLSEITAKRYGTCKLTGTAGQFVKSHIIPKSLTKPAYEGGMFWQGGSSSKPQKRRTSWYDQGIVTREGEDILADLDSWAIKFLRSKRLVWSGFGPIVSANVDIDISDLAEGLDGYGVRYVNVDDPKKLRQFCLSLLWRASVSTLPEMSEVAIGLKLERKLARYLTGELELPLTIFPCEVIQHHQVGFPHNQTPIKDKRDRTSRHGDILTISTYRFYFDGLVLHFNIGTHQVIQEIAKSECAVGFSDRLLVTCIPWHRSREKENLEIIVRNSINLLNRSAE